MPAHLHSVLVTLYISSALILVRTVYRTVEYFSASQIHVVPGFDPMTISPIIRYEWFFWVFEATIMLGNTLLLNFRHPAMYLPKSNKIYLAEDGVTEIIGPGYEDRRNFVFTIIDPCDLVGFIRGRDKKERYWENHERVLPNRVIHSDEAKVKPQVRVDSKSGTMNFWTWFLRAFFPNRGFQGREFHVDDQVKSEKIFQKVDIEGSAGRHQV
jgi:hypothetical protein